MASAETLIGLLGYYDNFDEPEPIWNRVSTIIPLVLSFLVVTWICVIFRMWVRFKVIYSPGWDDFFVGLVLLSGTIGTICIVLSTQWGMGKHFLTIPYGHMKIYLRYFYIANATYCVSTTSVKMALILQYLRVFKKEEKMMRKISRIALVITGLWGLAYSFMAWVPCFPVAGYWDYYLGAKCYGFGSLKPNVFFGTYTSSSATNMILDLVVLAIPVPLYFRKDTSNKTKMGLLGLFFMGVLINFLSMWRLVTVIRHRAATYPTFDPTWYGPISVQLGALEIDCATICASVPVFWPVLTAKIDQIFITHEIRIERIHRFEPVVDDHIELHRDETKEEASTVDGTDERPHSCNSSRASLNGMGSSGGNSTSTKGQSLPASKEAHYMDDFIQSQVNPFTSMDGVTSEVRAEKVERKRSVIAIPARK